MVTIDGSNSSPGHRQFYLTCSGSPALERCALASSEGREKRYRVDEAQLARAVAQLNAVGNTWDARLRRIKQIAEAINKVEKRSK